jgi:hypothetical protein
MERSKISLRRGGMNRMWLKEAWVCIYMRVQLAEWVKI